MESAEIGDLSLDEWLGVLDAKYANPKFRHLTMELVPGEAARYDTADLVSRGMSTAEAELRVKASVLATAKQNALADLDRLLRDSSLDLLGFEQTRSELVLKVYVLRVIQHRPELDRVNRDIQVANATRGDIELAKALVVRHYNSRLLRVDADLHAILS